jgi:hypothetical protein
MFAQANFSMTAHIQSGTTMMLENVLQAVTVINNTTENVEASLLVDLSTASGQQVFTAQTSAIELLPGANYLVFGMDMSYGINFSTSTASQILTQTGILPYGSYNVCFNLMNTLDISLVQTCNEISVDDFSGPEALFPTDSDTITDCMPNFTWTPLVPFSGATTYQFVIAEVNTNQSPNDALLNNIPVLSQSTFFTQYLLLPSIYTLQDSTNYVWQVSASIGSQLVGMSSPEAFQFSCDNTDTIPPVFLDFKGYSEPKYIEGDDYLNVFPSDSLKVFVYNHGSMKFLVYDIIYFEDEGQEVVIDIDQLPVFELKQGYNLIDIPLLPFGDSIPEESIFYFRCKVDNGNTLIKYKLNAGE